MTTKATTILMQMGSDPRIPREAIGYVADLLSPTAVPSVTADRLRMLSRYVPDLVSEFQQASE